MSMMVRVLCATVFFSSIGSGGIALAAEYDLVAAVIVSRHGVRSPIAGHVSLSDYAAEPWPAWPVGPGYLTPRGAALAQLLGAYYREYYSSQGLLPANGCPPKDRLIAWADVDQRTLLTAQSLLEGMFPGCNFAPESAAGASADPLFHPTRAGVCRLDGARVRASVVAGLRGGLASLNRMYRAQIEELQSVLKCCQPAVCRAVGARSKCTLHDLPNTMVTEASGGVHLSGPIAIGSTASEVFLLQYAQGFPDRDVGWGRASTPETIRPLMRLHGAEFDLMERTPYIAARQGSALLARILSTLQRAVDRGGAEGPVLTLLVGHDTNLANLGGMLELNWALPAYLENETPPAGAMHFHLLRERQSKAYAVRVRYLAQTPDQMRSMTALSLGTPPNMAFVTSACATGDGTCEWSEFAQLASRAIDRSCVPGQN
jgi:4-phytase/acid phosphatase